MDNQIYKYIFGSVNMQVDLEMCRKICKYEGKIVSIYTDKCQVFYTDKYLSCNLRTFFHVTALRRFV